ncbi:MAG: glycosyltransferase family 2 protein [Acidobacteriota bacterium]|jgi:glycosyltransferase involved in cell wall biosynthesis|nr:glycosyltransferase family 2 protein [Acidobacteriota bacterium]
MDPAMGMKISAVIIAYNEEDRLPDALASLEGVADEIVVIDSYSNDRTVEIAHSAGAKVWQNRFEDYGRQKNFAMKKAGCEWILNIDADERVSPELKRAVSELKEKGAQGNIAAFAIKRKTFYLGRWIRHSGWYPDRKVRLFRKSVASWQGRIHERLTVNGDVADLAGDILHFTYRDIGDHVRRLERYSTFLAEEIVKAGKNCLSLRLLLLPPVTFLRHFLWKLGFLDGFPGLVIATVQSWGTALKYLKAIDLKRRQRG